MSAKRRICTIPFEVNIVAWYCRMKVWSMVPSHDKIILPTLQYSRAFSGLRVVSEALEEIAIRSIAIILMENQVQITRRNTELRCIILKIKFFLPTTLTY